MTKEKKIIELTIRNPEKIYEELAVILAPEREEPARSVLFIVEGTKEKPIIGIRYPGKKVKKRQLKVVRKDSALWANLYDFEVVPYENGKEVQTTRFTFEELLTDFDIHKKQSDKFWEILKELYKYNTITKTPPDLEGIEPLLYLRTLKWIWIQEDFNYRLSWEEVNSPVRYRLETRTGNSTKKGAGRGKFFGAMVLLKNGFSFKQVKKIIPLY